MPALTPQFAEKTNLPPRDPDEHYATPPEPVALMVKMLDIYVHTQGCTSFVDVGAGDGVWGKVLRSLRPRAYIVGIEKRDIPKPQTYDTWIKRDATYFSVWPKVEVAFGNPPYLKSGMVDWVADIITRHRITAFLLRTDWLGSQIRYKKLFQKNLVFMAQSVSRIHFEGRGKNQYREYAFYVWDTRSLDTPKIYWFDHKDGSIHKNFKRDYKWLMPQSVQRKADDL